MRVFLQFQATRLELERIAPFVQNAETNICPISLPYSDAADTNSRFFDFQVNGILNEHIRGSLPTERFEVFDFVCGLRFVPTCSIGNGISWIELYVLFLVHAKQTEQPIKCKAGASLCKRLRVFTSHARSVVSCFFGGTR